MRAATVLCTLMASMALAGSGKKATRVAPAPLAKAAELLEGAERIDGKQRCTFSTLAEGCILKVKTSCKRQMGSTSLEYWYTTAIPLGSLDPARTTARVGAGGRAKTWGVVFATRDTRVSVVTDSGDKSEHDSGVIDFAQGKGAAGRAQQLAKLLKQANKACR